MVVNYYMPPKELLPNPGYQEVSTGYGSKPLLVNSDEAVEDYYHMKQR